MWCDDYFDDVSIVGFPVRATMIYWDWQVWVLFIWFIFCNCQPTIKILLTSIKYGAFHAISINTFISLPIIHNFWNNIYNLIIFKFDIKNLNRINNTNIGLSNIAVISDKTSTKSRNSTFVKNILDFSRSATPKYIVQLLCGARQWSTSTPKPMKKMSTDKNIPKKYLDAYPSEFYTEDMESSCHRETINFIQSMKTFVCHLQRCKAFFCHAISINVYYLRSWSRCWLQSQRQSISIGLIQCKAQINIDLNCEMNLFEKNT